MKITSVHHWYFAIGRWATVLAFLVIACLAFLETPALANWDDKAKHILAFTALTFGLMYYWRIKWLSAVVILLLYAIGIEMVQYFIPSRTVSINDVLADVLGMLLGISGYVLIMVVVRKFGLFITEGEQ